QAFVQGVRQLVLDRARDALPVLGIGEPVRTVGGERPGSDMRDTVRQRVDIAVGAIGLLDLASEPVGGNGSFPHEKAVERGGELSVSGGGSVGVIRPLAKR